MCNFAERRAPLKALRLPVRLVAAGGLVVGLLLGSALHAPGRATAEAPGPAVVLDHVAFLPLFGRGDGPNVEGRTALTTTPWRGTASSPFGIWVNNAFFVRSLPSLAGLNAGWTRVAMTWADFEPLNTDPPQYRWEMYDRIFAEASKANLSVIATISSSPAWAAEYMNGPIEDLEAYAQFVAAAVNRYKAPPYGVKHWEVYNEPDNASEAIAARSEAGIGYWGRDPEAYVALLQASYRAIKSADPEAQVLLGGLALDWFTDEGGPFAPDFLERVLALGGGRYFDAANFHYYPDFRWRWDIGDKARYVRGVLARYGLDKPLVVTEVGSRSDQETEQDQAAYLPKAMSRGVAAGLKAVVWFLLFDDPNWSLVQPYALVNPDLSRKRAYPAYQTMLWRLQGARFQRPLSFAGAGAADLEGYAFQDPNGRRLYVLWSNGEAKTVQFRGGLVQETGLYGESRWHGDAGDGLADGRVSILVDATPRYLLFND